MPAGRPIWRPWPQWLAVLYEMRDGRWYTRPALRRRVGLHHNSLSPALIKAYRRGCVIWRPNALFDHTRPKTKYSLPSGNSACPRAYRITDEGLARLEREAARRARLLLG